ncbi:MAG TPA: cytochrome c biogenesis protein CcdA [Myxococcota bacterium]|nr:cytochrome c biogenesis protein CcdA [Myxococcota bacterium]
MTELGSHTFIAFAAGLISVLSPCVLPLMPAYLSLVSGISVEEMQEGGSGRAVRRRVMLACAAFVIGFSCIFVLMGVGAFAIGNVLRSWQLELLGIRFGFAQLAGVFIILLGLHMTGLAPIRSLYRDTRFQLQFKQSSALSALLVGAGFALGWSPCIGPPLAMILTLAGSEETAFQGMALLMIYSVGLAIPFLIAGWSIEYFFRAFSRLKQHFRKLEIASGSILVAVGLLLVTDQLSALNGRFRFMTEWVSAAERMIQ